MIMTAMVNNLSGLEQEGEINIVISKIEYYEQNWQ